MKRFSYLVGVFFCVGAGLPAAAQVWQGAYQSGALWLRNNTRTVSVADAAGNVYVGGEFTSNAVQPTASTATFGTTVLTASADSSQGFIAKISPTGQWLWAVPVGRRAKVGSDRGVAVSGLAVTPTGDVVATGVFGRTLRLGTTTLVSAGDLDGYVGRLSGATGQWTWAERFGGPNQDISAALALTPTGDVVLCGHFLSLQLPFGTLAPLVLMGGTGDSFVAQLNGTTRQWQWATSARGNYSNRANAVAVDGSGRAVVTGEFRSDALAMGTLPPLAVTLGSGGVRSNDVYVAQLSPTGQWLWSRSFGQQNQDEGQTLAVTAAGEVAVGGEYNGLVAVGPSTINGSGAFVAKFSAAGQGLWAASVTGATGSSRNNTINHLAFDGAGQVLAAGAIFSPMAFFQPTLMQLTGLGAFVGRLSAAGTWQWVRGVGGADAHSVLPRANGQVVAVGQMASNPTVFGPISLPLIGNEQNVFVATLVPSPNGVEEAAADATSFRLTPNPARGGVRVGIAADPNQPRRAELLDALGRRVGTGVPVPAGATTANLPLTGLAPGLYVVRVGGLSRRLVVE